MIIIPAVDIREGKCAQLVQGKPGTERYYGDPVDVARGWEEKGAQLLHLIDLDAALGQGDNLGIVKKVCEEVSIPVQFGGGIRSIDKAKEVLNMGVDRAILGTLAIEDPTAVETLCKQYGKNRLMVAVDSKGGKVVTGGWTKETGINTVDIINKLEAYVFGFLLTDVDQEGLMQGIDEEEFKVLNNATSARICASGGISSQEDIESLDCLGIWGCVIGKALYEGKIKLDLHKNKTCI